MTNTYPTGSSRSSHMLPVLITLVLAFALRVWQLDAQALRGDEGFSLVVWMNSLADMFGSMATVDPQPPGALLAFYGWVRLVGESVFTVRYHAVLSSILTVAALYGMGCILGGRAAGLLAALFAAINPLQIWLAQDARSAALWTCVSALASWMLLRLLRCPDRSALWIGYVLLAAAGLYVFYLEAFVLIAHNLYVLINLRQRPQLLKPWIAAQVAVLVLILPWYGQLRLYQGGYAPTAGPANLPWAFLAFTFGETLPGWLQPWPPESMPAGLAAWLAIALVLLVLLCLWWRGDRRAALFATLYAFVPLLLLAALAWMTGRGYFRVRYLASSSPGWTLILALGIRSLISDKPVKRAAVAIGAAALVLITSLNISALWQYRFNPAYAKAPDWPGLMALLDRYVQPDEAVLYNFPDPSFTYYYRGDAPAYLLPDPTTNLESRLEELSRERSAIWLIPQPSPIWDAQQQVRGWLDGHMQFGGELVAPTNHVRRYVPYEGSAADITVPLEGIFGEFALLKGYRLKPGTRVHPGDVIVVDLFWEPLDVTPSDLTVFFHLLGPARVDGSPLWAQDDHPPQWGRANTTIWRPGGLIRDAYVISVPPDAPAGEYRIAIGFYNPEDGVRSPASGGLAALDSGDGIVLAEITVNEGKPAP